MENVTTFHPSLLTLNFGPLTSARYLYATIVLFGYLLILTFSGAVITASLTLHNIKNDPLYIFLSALCLNGVYGGSAFFPSLFVNLLQKTQMISYIGCLAQVFCVHTYGSFEYTILTAMAYDRYVFIGNPLRYHSIMTSSKVLKLVLGALVYSCMWVGTNLILTIRLPLCSSQILKIYCDNFSVVRLSCANTTVNNIFGLIATTAAVGPTSLLIFYSYASIFKVCRRFSREVKSKALQTCSPHLIVLANFMISTLFEVLLHRTDPTTLPYELRILMTLQFLVVSPILNPLIYGLKVKEIKEKIVLLFQSKVQPYKRTDIKHSVNIMLH
ncbi:olfactory receptor 52D1-like [Gastrophryne carolinensis]